MKQLILFLAAGSMAMSTQAQERYIMSSGPKPIGNVPQLNAAEIHNELTRHSGASKGTSATDRWYNYADFLRAPAALNATIGISRDSIRNDNPYMWNDDKSRDIYTSGLDTNNFVSLGVVLDPTFHGFNNGLIYPIGDMKITSANAYTVDSAIIVGSYGTNPASIGYTDTAIMSFVHGNLGPKSSSDVWTSGGSLSSAHYGSISYWSLTYDSLNNRANGVANPDIVCKVPMAYNDTNTFGVYYKKIALMTYAGTDMSVAAGERVGVSLSFKTGDPTFTPYDTVFRGSPFVPIYKHNMLRPYVSYITTGGTTVEWPDYNPSNDRNAGLFKVLPDTAKGWGKSYIPMYAWSNTTTGGAATNQFPYIWVHLKCTGCPVIDNDYLGVNSVINNATVTAVPNPADNEVNIHFSLTEVANVTVSLTNMVGQVVSAQTLNAVSKGKAVFNTTTIPAGIYVFSVQANGERTTGRVVVAH